MIVDDLTMNGSAGHFDGRVTLKRQGEGRELFLAVTLWTD